MSESSPEYRIVAEDRGRVHVLSLAPPEKLNAFTAGGYRALTGALDAAAEDEGVSVVVLTGIGHAFTAGVDLSEMERPGGSEDLGASFDPMYTRLATFPKPMIGAVNGLAVGLGATILLHCDLVIVDEVATIRMPFIALGTCAEAGSSWLLPMRVGMQQASWLVLSGSPMTAQDAVANGFAFAVAPEGQVVRDAVVLAEQMAVHQTAALTANKQLLREGWADRLEAVWIHEKAAMVEMARRLGPIGWSSGGGQRG